MPHGGDSPCRPTDPHSERLDTGPRPPAASPHRLLAAGTALVAVFGVPVARVMARARRAALGTAVFAVSHASFAFLPARAAAARPEPVLAAA